MRTVGGIDLDVDLYHQSERGADWTRYGPLQVADSDHVLVLVNAAWRQRWEGRNDPTEGAGAVAEIDVLRSIFIRNQDEFTRKVVIVLLPGSSDADIPPGLDRLQRRRVHDYGLDGLSDLLRLITGQPLFEPPPVRSVPLLPPATRQAIEHEYRVLQASATGAEQSHGSTAGTVASEPTAVSGSGDGSTTLDAERTHAQLALLHGVQRQRPSAGPESLPGTSLNPLEVEQLLAALLQANVLSAERRTRAADEQQIGERHALLKRALEGRLDRANRCWLTLVGVAGSAGDADDTGREPVRDRRHRDLQRWAESARLPVLLDTSTPALRQPGLVVFPGEHQRSGTAVSTRWRLELADDGSGLVAADVAGSPQLQPGTGQVAFAGWPGESVIDSQVYLPVRQDWLELWLLVQLEVLAHHVGTTSVAPSASLNLEASLEPPVGISMRGHHNSEPLGVRLVREIRDVDGERLCDEAPPGAVDLPLGQPVGAHLTVTAQTLHDARGLVRTARRLAVRLLEHFGIEETTVLHEDGTLDAFAAARAEQQPVHQHAEALGLPVDPNSPQDRRRKYEEKLAEARARLRP